MGLHGRRTEAAPVQPTLCVLIAALGSRSLAFEADFVDGLLTVDVGGRTGVVVVQGVAYRPVDLARRMGLSVEPEGPNNRVVLLSRNGMHGCVRVAQAKELREVECARLMPLPRQFTMGERNWYRGLILHDTHLTLVLNTSWVLHGIDTRCREISLQQHESGLRIINDDQEDVSEAVPEC